MKMSEINAHQELCFYHRDRAAIKWHDPITIGEPEMVFLCAECVKEFFEQGLNYICSLQDIGMKHIDLSAL